MSDNYVRQVYEKIPPVVEKQGVFFKYVLSDKAS